MSIGQTDYITQWYAGYGKKEAKATSVKKPKTKQNKPVYYLTLYRTVQAKILQMFRRYHE